MTNNTPSTTDEKIGIMLCGHGSRDNDAVEQFAKLATALKKRFPQYPVEYGYLEFATPIIRTGLDALKDQGVTRVLAVPGMLFAAGHAKNDIPSVLNTYAAANDLQIDYGKELGVDPKMLKAAADRIQEAIDGATVDVPIHETLLVVVGRGASDPDANSNASKITRMMWEGFGFGWAETAYSGVTFPLVAPALEHAVKLGYKRIIVFPYFLFTGILIKRIYDAVDDVASQYPDTEFIKAPFLNDHPQVINTFVERLNQIVEGDNHMNCGLCKYRTQVLGFEAQVGEAQESHHHHSEGGQDHSHDHSPDHTHSHDHPHGHDHGDHHHTPYPHADHPLGPKTLKET